MKAELITSLEDFKALESDWNKLLPLEDGVDLPLTWAWFDAWLRGFWSSISNEDSQAQLHILTIWDEKGIAAIAPMAIHDRRYYGIRICTLNALANGTTPYWDLVLRPGLKQSRIEQICAEIFTTTAIAITNLRRLRDNSPLRRFLAHSQRYLWGDVDVMRTPLVSCAGSLEAHLSSLSRKYRSRLRKKLKTFDMAADTRVEHIILGASLDPVFNQLVDISRRSWKFSRGRDISSRPDLRQFLSAIVDHLGAQRRAGVWIAYRGDEPIAYELHLRSGKVSFPIQADYVESAGALSPGSIVEYHALAAAFEDPALELYDTCATNYWYLQRLTNSYRETYETMVFSKNPRARLVQFSEFTAKPALIWLRQMFSKAE